MFAFDQRIYVFTNTRCFAICDTFYSEILIFFSEEKRALYYRENLLHSRAVADPGIKWSLGQL